MVIRHGDSKLHDTLALKYKSHVSFGVRHPHIYIFGANNHIHTQIYIKYIARDKVTDTVTGRFDAISLFFVLLLLTIAPEKWHECAICNANMRRQHIRLRTIHIARSCYIL